VEAPAGDTRVVEIDLAGAGSRREVTAPADAAEPSPTAAELPAGPQQPPPDPVTVPSAAVQPGESQPPPVAAQEPSQPVATAAEGGWAVQVAALSKQDAADEMVARLRGQGYPAFVLEHRAGGKVLYRVRVGPEAQRERAEALAGRLRAEGLSPAVVSQP